MVLLALLAACAPAAATSRQPTSSPHPRQPPLAALLIMDRLAGADSAVPDLIGQTPARADRTLARAGRHVTVVRLSRGAAVTAQYPPPGAPLPANGRYVVWVGRPRPPASAPTAAPPTAPAPLLTPLRSPAASLPTHTAAPPPAPAEPAADAAPGSPLRGQASWYGPGFAGRITACGGLFDPEALTLASRELGCGTQVRVSGPGGSARATVTDWGPAAWTGRRFDLSSATFAAVADLGAGVVEARVTPRR